MLREKQKQEGSSTDERREEYGMGTEKDFSY